MVHRVMGASGVDVRAVRTLVSDALVKGPAWVDLGDVDLITSEVATNARRYSASGLPGGGVWVAVLHAANRLRVEIRDDGGAETVPRIPDETAESGRGLLIVAALTTRWGFWVGTNHKREVTVWFEVVGGTAG
ncbi:ATP-binding protein [Actinomadura viridis]|uniref:ATP-binding protein n=1 Tax=Actinomadura viridis TaxID=58110 RepID=UPI0036A16690